MPEEITDQTVVTSLADTDYLIAIDRSDTTQGADGSMALIEKQNVVTGILFSSAISGLGSETGAVADGDTLNEALAKINDRLPLAGGTLSGDLLSSASVGIGVAAADASVGLDVGSRAWICGRDVTGVLTNYLLCIGTNHSSNYDVSTAVDYGGICSKPSFQMSANVSALYGTTIKPTVMGDGTLRTVTSATGLLVEDWTVGDNAAVNTSYGVQVHARTSGTNKYGVQILGPTGNTSGTNTALHITAPANGGSGSAYAVNVAGGICRIDGNIGMNVDPTHKLDIAVNLVAEGARVGKAFVGNWNGSADYAVFCHKDNYNVTNEYGILQDSAGATFLNSASGQDLRFSIGGTGKMYLRSTGEFEVDGNVKFDGLPTSDPAVAGRLWSDSGTVKVSAG